MVQFWDDVELDRESDRPLYQQLEARIAAFIDDGRLAPGAKLPASRDLATKLGINRNTLRKKITDLHITVKREP